jgi:hypothetical protein
MLRHVISLSILLLTLLAAGIPVFACGEVVPMHDCCPNGPHAPCDPSGSSMATAAAVAAPANDIRHPADHAGAPALLVVLATLTTAYAPSPSADEWPLISPPLCDSTLYLSTGRLRL